MDHITEGVRGNKCVAVARVINEQFDVGISKSQVYNHIISWRAGFVDLET